MTIKEARAAGSKYTVYFALAGLATAYVIMAAMYSPDEYLNLGWIAGVDFKLNLLVGGAILLLVSYVLGRVAGRMIIIEELNSLLVGVMCGVLTLLVTAFLSGWLGFFREGSGDSHGFADYVWRPTILLTIFGFVPAAIFGIFLGMCLKKMR